MHLNKMHCCRACQSLQRQAPHGKCQTQEPASGSEVCVVSQA